MAVESKIICQEKTFVEGIQNFRVEDYKQTKRLVGSKTDKLPEDLIGKVRHIDQLRKHLEREEV